MRARSSGVRATDAAATFSANRSGLRVPGIGTTSCPCASSQARASWVTAMPLPSARAASSRIAATFFA